METEMQTSWRLTLRVIAILAWIVGIIWFIVEPGFEPLLAVLSGTAVFLGSLAVRDEPRPNEAQRQHNRQAMLNLVESTWVKGVLENSLHGAVLMELGLEHRQDAVEYPLDMVLQTRQENRTLPPGKKMVDVFNEMGCNLLILGEPGSGKTTMLLDLGRDLIERAEVDTSQPIPVVFNLSSWSDPKQSIDDWLVEELRTKYNIPKKTAQVWVEQDELLLLLDGLDEVASERRDTCVQAINTFCEKHIVSIAVCSRTEEYENLKTQLKLQSAVVTQPITLGQIEDYLTILTARTKAGDEFAPILRTIKADEELQEFVNTPLMLNIMLLAAKGLSAQKLANLQGVKIRRKYLFDVYTEEMFGRRRREQPYTPEQTVKWLAWLAGRMTRYDQTVFLLERMQPSWLCMINQQWFYRIVAGLGIGLSFGLIIGLNGSILSTGLIFGLENNLLVGVSYGLVIGLIFGLSDWITQVLRKTVGGLYINSIRVLIFSWLGLIIFGLLGVLSGWLNLGLKAGLWRGFAFGLGGGLIGGISSASFGNLEGLKPVEGLKWSWKKASRGLGIGLIIGILIPVVVALGTGLISVFIEGEMAPGEEEAMIELFGPSEELNLSFIERLVLNFYTLTGSLKWWLGYWALVVGPTYVLIFSFIAGLTTGLGGTKVRMKTRPNQGVWLSMKYCIIGLGIGMIGGITVGLCHQLASSWLLFGLIAGDEWFDMGVIAGLRFGLSMGLLIGLIAGLSSGGHVFVQHFSLRFILYRTGQLPFSLVPFLDYAAERIFLRKVGGGYIFIHRYLMEYFAALEAEG